VTRCAPIPLSKTLRGEEGLNLSNFVAKIIVVAAKPIPLK